MSEPYLIAHLVRGEPAFDIAKQVECSVCNTTSIKEIGAQIGEPCDNCEGGYWWIIPTSGHRAYPYWCWNLEATELSGGTETLLEIAAKVPIPPNWPDHYAPSAAPKGQGLISNLAERLGLIPKPPTITRRR